MDDDLDHLDPGAKLSAEWGLASLAVGGVLCIVGPVGLILAIVADRSGEISRWDQQGQWVIAAGGYLAALVLLVFPAIGVLFGFWSLRAAWRRELPAARGAAGVMLNLFALLIAAGAGAAWHFIIRPHL
jgi:hypothetical protein